MSLYKTGTVSVNNGQNTVTGNGTSFIDIANVQLGDLFTVDGSKFYEIYQVDTNTQFRIRNIVTGGNFAETTVTNGDYAIVRNFTSQTSAEIAAKVLAVQQKWQNREEEMTDWFYTANDWATVTSINGDTLSVMTPNGINNLLGTAATYNVTTSTTDTTANRLTKVGDFGIGLTPNSLGINADGYNSILDMPSGNYRIASGISTFAVNAGINQGGVLSVLSFNQNDKGALFLGNSGGVDDEFKFISAGSQDLRTVYHSGNTNFNEVISDGSTGAVFIPSQAYNTTEIRFYVTTFLNKVVTSISVTGTFSLSYYQNQAATGLGASDITLLGSSKNLAILRITTVSGLDLNRLYTLFAEQSSAKIQLNF
tara:strand:+ start:444 stop:1544 length:1101 start_codon:yes stop_codon:yes gene_type:complete